MGNMPSVEREIVALTTLGPHQVMYNPRCLGKECQKTDRLMCQTYNAAGSPVSKRFGDSPGCFEESDQFRRS